MAGENMAKSNVWSLPDDLFRIAQELPAPAIIKDRRQHKRHQSARMKLTFLGAEHGPINWSLGGFLIADKLPQLPDGTVTEGFVEIVGQVGRFAVRVELVRRDKRSKRIAFAFIEPSPALLDALAESD